MSRFLKGERIFPSEVPVIATTGIGTMVATDEQRVRTVAKIRTRDGKTKQWVATFQACLVGQSYKQVILAHFSPMRFYIYIFWQERAYLHVLYPKGTRHHEFLCQRHGAPARCGRRTRDCWAPPPGPAVLFPQLAPSWVHGASSAAEVHAGGGLPWYVVSPLQKLMM